MSAPVRYLTLDVLRALSSPCFKPFQTLFITCPSPRLKDVTQTILSAIGCAMSRTITPKLRDKLQMIRAQPENEGYFCKVS